MSPQAGKTWVLVAAGLMFGILFVKRDSFPDVFKAAWAAGVVVLGLSVLADVAPEIAGPAALLVLMAVYWRHRGALGGVVTAKANPTPAKAGANPNYQTRG